MLIDNGTANLTDTELDQLDDYDLAILTVARQGGADGDDSFAFQTGNGLSLVGGNILKVGVSIATFTNAAGTLTVTFTNAIGQTPTSADADNVLRQITYSNSSVVPPANVTLDVTLNDGNVGGGGAQAATASVTVSITPSNSTPQVLSLGVAPAAFTEGGAAVLLDNGDANLIDAELDALDDYDTAVLAVARQGGANADDSFGFQAGNGLTLVGGTAIHKGGGSIASFGDAGGTLTVTFTNAKEPLVTVIVGGFQGVYETQVRILGEATRPQTLPYRDKMTVLDVMIAVGGLTEFAAGNKARLVRTVDGAQHMAVLRLEDLIKDGDISANVPIAPGDVIIIPEAWF